MIPPMPPPFAATRVLTFAAAMSAGVIASMVTEIMLGRRGIELAGVWPGVVAANAGQMRAAVAWWSIAGTAFIVSFAIAAVMARFAWLYLRGARGALLVALVLALASISRESSVSHGTASAHAQATFIALVVAMLMAGFGAFFALRR
jgi:hypothetical protein